MSFARRSRLMSIPTLLAVLALIASSAAVALAADEQPKKDDDLAKRAYDLLLGGDQKKPADDAKPADDKKPADDGEQPKPAPAPAPAPADSAKPQTPGAPWPGGATGGSSDTPKPKPIVPPAAPLPGAGGALTGDPTPAPRSAPAPAPAPRPAPTASDYTIKEGDTFSSIAIALYGDEKKWAAIAQANPLVDPTKLKVGQKIRLPDLAKAEQERSEQFEQIAKQVAAPAATEQTVTVQPGDSLSHIAHRVYGKARHWRLIFEANKDQLDTPDSVKVGQKLKIPPKPADEPAKTQKKAG